MTPFLQRMRYQTRWQVYARVLPVVFLAVLSVGVCGSIVFTRFATETLVEHEAEEAQFLVQHLQQQVLIETMSLEARKGDLALVPGAMHGVLETVWATDLLRSDNLAGVAVVRTDSGSTVHLQSMCFEDSLTSSANQDLLRAWISGFEVCAPVKGRPSAPVLQDSRFSLVSVAARDLWHPTYVLPPLLLENVSDRDRGGDSHGSTFVLPVLVCDDERENGQTTHSVFFLDLARMMRSVMAEKQEGDEGRPWWCALDPAGRIIATDDGPEVGDTLAAQPMSAAAGPFAVTSGADLVGDWRPGEIWSQSLFGDQLNCWVVAAGQVANFPVATLIGHQAHELRSSALRFIFLVVGVALLSLGITVFGVTRIIGRLSTRLQVLSGSMAQVAEGQYSHRIPTTARDEVGRLMAYFNAMAASLEETSQQLDEKTVHLETALAHRELLDRAKDDFLVLISHEVRTPLTAIMGGANILKNLVKRTSEADRAVLENLNITEVVQIIENSGDRLHGFMNDALQMTTIQSNNMEIELAPVTVDSLVEMGLCGLREMAQERGIELVNQVAHEASWQVLCDDRVMMLAFQKVLKNAIVHNYEGGCVEIREVGSVPGHDGPDGDLCRLTSCSSFAPYADLAVTWRVIEIFNTGEAIPRESCDALFNKFELVGRIENHKQGSGLSLPIARAAVEHHGGAIRVHSVKLKGNFFYIMLPTVATADLPVSCESSSATNLATV